MSQNAMNKIQVIVSVIHQVTPLVKQFVLTKADGSNLPAFSGGSHIVVSLNIHGRIHRNPYSLMSSPDALDSYQIGVRRQEQSRGGSVFMHDQVQVGTPLEVSYPVNLFALHRLARKHLLIAGGIGITPFLSQLHDLKRNGSPYELHYAYRAPEHAAFTQHIKTLAGDDAHFYAESRGQTLGLAALLSAQPLGTHVYVCGPTGMVNAVTDIAQSLGWPPGNIHSEQFLAPPIGSPISLRLAQSELEITVPPEMSILEAMEAAGVDAPYLCRGGACGRCELEVLEHDGELLHYDHFLSDAEKYAGKKIMPCVSRAKCEKLVLNI